MAPLSWLASLLDVYPEETDDFTTRANDTREALIRAGTGIMASHIFVVITLQKQSVFICDMFTGVVKGTKHAFIEHNGRTNLATVDNNCSVSIPLSQLYQGSL